MDKVKKKRIKRYITWACLAAVVLVLTIMPLLAKNEAAQDGPQASILTAEAELTSVSSALHGGGTLEAQGEETVNIPTGVKITEFLVKNGDTVTEGTPLAKVDKVSVMTAITGVNETLEYLQDELEDARDEAVDSTIPAAPGGRVKKIFAQKGESVQEVMLRDGALALLSIDGLMAVKIENNVSVTTGENVQVRIPDGTAEGNVVTGRVESNLNGVKIITIEDEGYAVGTEVTVSTESGEAVGSGDLYVHNAWKATAYAGTISQVHAKEESTLSAGSTLFTLEDTDYSGQLQYRTGQYREYTELLQKLLKMYESGTIDAPCDGVVSGVDKDSTHLLSAEGEWEAELLNSDGSQSGFRVILLGNTSAEFEVDASFTCDCSDQCQGPKHNPACPKACTGDEACKGTNHREDCVKRCTRGIGCPAQTHYPDCITRCTHAEKAGGCNALTHYADCIHSCSSATEEGTCRGSKYHYDTCIESCISSDGTKDCPATKTHKTSCIEKCSHADVSGVCEAEEYHYGDCIEACISSTGKNTPCSAEKHKNDCYFRDMTYQAYAAKVRQAAPQSGQLLVYLSSQPFYGSSMSQLKSSVAAGFQSLTFPTDTAIPAANAGQFKENDIVLIVSGYKGEELVSSEVVLYQSGSTSGTPGFDIGGMMGGMDLSGMIGGFAGYGSYSGYAVPEEDEGLYDLEGSTLLTVTPKDTMKLTVTLDEKDIAKVQLGMDAKVKVEALRGETFPAKVTKIGTSGTNEGGSSKFTVELTLDAEGDMLSGMSATARIPLVTRENVLTIPLAALEESGARTVVYTALDEKTGKPGAPVEVETGISDGENVEILSGLGEGSTVYYSYYDTLELDTSAEASRFTFG